MQVERLKELVNYNPTTGIFTWNKVSRYHTKLPGDVAGGVSSSGFHSMTLDGKHYQAHKLAYLYMTGRKVGTVLHLNKDRLDNRWCNLGLYSVVPGGETTQAILQDFFNYDPLTGVFTRTKSTNKNAIEGTIAGGISKNGYIIIPVGENRHYAHRLAFLYMEGKFPDVIVDHIDGNKANNAWTNLRHATYSENNCNSPRGGSNTGYKGITLGTDNYYHANCQYQGKVYQKVFKTIEEAIAFTQEHRDKLHGEFVNHGV
jgi:hypothetical protein